MGRRASRSIAVCLVAIGLPVPGILRAAPDIRVSPLTLAYNQQATEPIYLEIDWMESGTHSHKPSQAVVDRITQSFAAAGYTIHIDVSNAIPHENTLPILTGPSQSPAVQAIMSQHFDHAADDRYHYSLWAHNFSLNGSFTTSSGIGDLPGRVHLVTLGSFDTPPGSFNYAFSHQVGTLIHELGHNLAQRHGGADHANYKPNYLSVMNYHYQLAGLGPTLLARGFAHSASGFDDFGYSHGLLPSLNENSLDENAGIGLGRAVDWNCNGTLQTGVAKDIQGSNWCTVNSGRSVLSDHDNWTSLLVLTDEAARLEPSGPPEICVTAEEHRPLAERIEALRAQGLLPPDGPDAYPAPDKSAAGQSFQIWNDGDAPLEVTGLALDVATSWIHWAPQAPFTVAPGKSQQVYVYADLGDAPEGKTARLLLVQSNDPDENPYPGGVSLVIHGLGAPPPCHVLTLSASGSGAAPAASPASSTDCPTGEYRAGDSIQLTASPAAGWTVGGWTGTADDTSTATTNTAVMPAADHAVAVEYVSAPAQALFFFTLPPCRAMDTRSGAALASEQVYTLELTGSCGIPASAVAVAVNITVVVPTGSGFLSVWPADLSDPGTSTLNFRAGQVKANNAVLRLATDGTGGVRYSSLVGGNGSVHVLLDVTGYFGP